MDTSSRSVCSASSGWPSATSTAAFATWARPASRKAWKRGQGSSWKVRESGKGRVHRPLTTSAISARARRWNSAWAGCSAACRRAACWGSVSSDSGRAMRSAETDSEKGSGKVGSGNHGIS